MHTFSQLKIRLPYYLFILLLIMPFTLQAQTITVKGTVTDQITRDPLAGVTIGIKGTSNGTITDGHGRYSIDVNNGADTLIITSVGYDKKEEAINHRQLINIQLSKNAKNLNEVVVVGYGTQKRADITGSVATLNEKRLQDLPNNNFAQALEGALPGVRVITNGGGAEGSNISIQIRGQKSITASTDPLIILDGIPYNGSISDINTTDISSINVLKDASAAAIYGSRASNGVIIITTKQGSSGKPVISYDTYTGLEKVANLPPVLSPEQFYKFKVTREGQSSITPSEQAIYDSRKFPDWLNLVLRTGVKTSHNLSIRGGSKAVKYYTSVNYLNSEGVDVNDHFRQLSTRVNLEATITSWLTYGTNTELTFDNRSGLAGIFGGDDGAYFFNPLTTAYDSLGKPTIYPWPEDIHFGNPLSPTLATNSDYTYKVFTNNYLQLEVPFIKGLGYRLNTGVEYQQGNVSTYYGRNTIEGIGDNGDLDQSNRNISDYTIENILTYDRDFNKNSINFTGLYSFEQDINASNGLNAQQFPSDILTAYQANVALLVQPNAAYTKRTLVSQMARLNYSYNGKYLLTLTARRDGSSVFGVNDKFGIFPSAAVGWNIANESFMKNVKGVSQLKLRLSYGSSGNQAINPYQTLAKMTTRSYVDDGTTEPGYVPSTLANPNLHWETTNTANAGIDFGFINGRIQGSLDVYNSRTHGLLLNRQISPVEGIDNIIENIGKTSNEGVELNVNTINIQTGDFMWSTSVNFSTNRNRIVSLYGNGLSDTLNQWFIGHPIQVNYGYVFNGIYQLNDDTVGTPQGTVHPGDAKIVDVNKDSKINASDRKIISNNVEPKFTWGMSNTFNYKGFSLYVFAQGSEGAKRINDQLNENGVQSGVRHNTIIKNWWTPTNPTNDYWANSLKSNLLNVPIVQSSSYVRIEDISLGYEFSNKLLQSWKLSRLKIYVETRNPFTFTKWVGLDPEFGSQTTVPLQKEYIAGLDISL